jgi:hypothetical protein
LDPEDNDLEDGLVVEAAKLRSILERGAKVCDLLLAGLVPPIERVSAGHQIDKLFSALRPHDALPKTDISDLENDYPDIHRELIQLRDMVTRLGEAEPERDDWRRLEAPKLRSEIELLMTLPSREQLWEDFEHETGSSDVILEASQLRHFCNEGLGVIDLIQKRHSKVPEAIKAVISSANLFENFPDLDLDWLEQENEQIVQILTKMRDLVDEVANAMPEQSNWRKSKLQSLFSTLNLQVTFTSSDIEQQIKDIDSDALYNEYYQLRTILSNAQKAFSVMV